MNPYYQAPDGLTLYHGDARAVLASLEPESVDCVVTSPPYLGLRKYEGVEPVEWADGSVCCYGLEPTVEMYVAHTVEVCRALWRVLKPTGSMWWNIGDSYNAYNGNRGPSKSISHKVAEQCPKLPTGSGLHAPDLKPKDLMLIPYRVAIALQADGWWVRSAITWAKKACMPESVTDRPTCATEMIWLLAKSATYYFDSEAVREKQGDEPTWEEYRKHLGHDWADDSKDIAEGRGHFAAGIGQRRIKRNAPALVHPNGRNLRNFWLLGPESLKAAHYAAFPSEIPRRAILAGTSERGCCPTCGKPWERVTEIVAHVPSTAATSSRDHRLAVNHEKGFQDDPRTQAVPRDYNGKTTTLGWRPTCQHDANPIPAVVLDPFVGSGTTLIVARQLGRRGVGIDASLSYLTDIAIPRIEAQTPNLFALEVPS